MNTFSNRLKIKDLPVLERPYEKFERFGAEALSNAELLAIVIKTGTKDETSVELAQRILKNDSTESGGMLFLINSSLEELRSIKGIGTVKAIQIKANMELAKRILSASKFSNRVKISCPADISNVVMEDLRYLNQEVFKGLLLNTRNQLIKTVDISTGTLNASLVHPREAFSEAVKCGCNSIAFVHNHPSGDPTPSNEDLYITERLVSSGQILGINVIDHVIIGDGQYISLKERNLL